MISKFIKKRVIKTSVLILFSFFCITCFSQESKIQAPKASVNGVFDVSQNTKSFDTTNVAFLDKNNATETKNDKIEYYKNGQNGIELIVKINNKTLLISTYDSKPSLKEEVAKILFNLYKNKIIKNDTLIKLRLEKAYLHGLCKLKTSDSYTNLSFYFEKIEWFDGRVEIHQGEQFIGKASSQPIQQSKQPATTPRKRIVSNNKKTLR